MKAQSLLALAMAPAALGHTIFTNLHINGADQGEVKAVRYRKSSPNYPLEDLSSKDMACNVGGDAGVAGLLTVPQGAKLTFEFKASLWDLSKPKLEPGHKGPCAVYLKKVNSATKDAGSGSGWFKIWDQGYDSASGQWCTTKLTPTGKLDVTLPKGLQPGEYLAKPELTALHNKGAPQFFTSCMQIKIEGAGDLVPESTVSIPGYIKKDDPSVMFDIYNKGKESTYKTPGPSVAKLVAAKGNSVEPKPVTSSATSSARPGITQPPKCEPVVKREVETVTERVTIYADKKREVHARRHGLWI